MNFVAPDCTCFTTIGCVELCKLLTCKLSIKGNAVHCKNWIFNLIESIKFAFSFDSKNILTKILFVIKKKLFEK